jgi:DNA-binding HxlR family transcriptional regulator
LVLRRLLLRQPLLEVSRIGSGQRRLTLLDVEILRAVERSSLVEGSLPELPEDLRASPSVLALKMRALMDGGLIGVRQGDASRHEIFLTAAGWSRLNAALSDQLW